MKSFEFCGTTDVLFDAGQENNLPDRLRVCGKKSF